MRKDFIRQAVANLEHDGQAIVAFSQLNSSTGAVDGQFHRKLIALQERIEAGLVTDYGDDPRDFAQIESYEDFLTELASLFGECARLLKAGKYIAIIVSDFRDKSRYVMFHADLARALEAYGLEMKGLKTLYQRHKRVFPYGHPYSYVPNIHNQFILILQKPKDGSSKD